jgi:hypothetical protein
MTRPPDLGPLRPANPLQSQHGRSPAEQAKGAIRAFFYSRRKDIDKEKGKE